MSEFEKNKEIEREKYMYVYKKNSEAKEMGQWVPGEKG